jgi:hypothetical protein
MLLHFVFLYAQNILVKISSVRFSHLRDIVSMIIVKAVVCGKPKQCKHRLIDILCLIIVKC